MKVTCISSVTLSALVALGTSFAAAAQSYPTTNIRMIVPYPPGGGADAAGRIVAGALSEKLNQQVIVDNRPGASGRIGTVLAAKAQPDGYTLLLGNVGPNAIAPAAYAKLPYNQLKDFAPISRVASTDYMLVVHPSLPTKSIRDIIELAKRQPGKINFASTGNLGGPHLAGELLKVQGGIDIVHVPYKGGSAAVTGIMGGEVEMIFASSPTVVPLVDAGRLRAIATTGLKRLGTTPKIPTVAETLPGYEVSQWYGVLAPTGTPKDILTQLHAEINGILKLPKVMQQFDKLGATAVGSDSPAHFSKHIEQEMQKWGDVVRKAGIKAE